MSFIEKRNGKNVLPLRNAVCGVDMPYWSIDHANDNENFIYGDAVDKLAHYEELEEQKRLLILPVPLGSKVYYAITCPCGNIDGKYNSCEHYGNGKDDMICGKPKDVKCPYPYKVKSETVSMYNLSNIMNSFGTFYFATEEEVHNSRLGCVGNFAYVGDVWYQIMDIRTTGSEKEYKLFSISSNDGWISHRRIKKFRAKEEFDKR